MKKFLLSILIVTMIVVFSGCKTERTIKTETETTATETEAVTAEPTEAKTASIVKTVTISETTATEVKSETLNLNEPLKGTLDEFGSLIQLTDRFSIAGTILDESLFEGQIVVGNAFAIHDNGFISQEGNVIFYYIAPVGGGRIRLSGFDGQFFVIDKNIMTLNQAIAAMRETLIRAHGATFKTIQFHELVRYGDPIK